MRKQHIGIYIITNKTNGKVYVGQSRNIYTRWIRHKSNLNTNKHENKYLQNSWNKYGAENFEFRIVEKISPDIFTDELINERECHWINFYNSLDRSKGYNIALGGGVVGLNGVDNGMYGKRHKESTKELMRNKALGRECYWKNKKLPKEIREKISNSKKYLVTTRSSKVVCITTGEIFDMIKLAKDKYNIRGNASVNEMCERNSCGTLKDGTPLIWMKYEDYVKGYEKEVNENKSNRKVICITTNKIFATITEGAEYYGKQRTDLSKYLRGQLKSCGKHPETGDSLKWMYYDDYLRMKDAL